ncbi:MAG: hypothetical protein CMJ31_08465 [Phycisphaerae bacterium]|nr:hypothetical protein [Phycisphaerae bacterium]
MQPHFESSYRPGSEAHANEHRLDQTVRTRYETYVRELREMNGCARDAEAPSIERSAALMTIAEQHGLEPAELLELITSPERTADRFIQAARSDRSASPRRFGR